MMHDTENTVEETPAAEEVAQQSTDDAPIETGGEEGDNEE